MINFDFLKNVQLVATESKIATPGRVSVSKQPAEGADLRLMKNGAIYPSEALVAKYNLEFPNRGVSSDAQGFDVFTGGAWEMYPAELENVVFIAAVSKSLPKVSLFGKCAYQVDDTPSSSVIEQGSVSAGKLVYAALHEAYGFEFAEDQQFVDLLIMEDISIPSPTNVFYIPKPLLSRKTGVKSTEHLRRDGIVVNPLVIYNPVVVDVCNDVPEGANVEESDDLSNEQVVFTEEAKADVVVENISENNQAAAAFDAQTSSFHNPTM